MANKYSWEENQINLLNRMLGDVPATIEKREGSFVYDTLSPVANEISKFYLRLDETYVRMFIQTSYAAYLDARALEFGLIRLNGDLAKGILNFTGSDGTEIHLGSVFQTKDGLQFVTTKAGVIAGGIAAIDAMACGIGTKYNVPANTITQFTTIITGVVTVTNNAVFTGGVDIESDDDFRRRLLERMQNSPGSGNKADYKRWAKEIEGIEYVKVVPLWAGPGTVKVVIGGKNGQPVTPEKVTEVQQYIDPTFGDGDGKAPVGATATIVNIVPVVIDFIITNLSIEDGYTLDTVKANIQDALTKFLLIAGTGENIRYTEAIAAVADTVGELDFTSLQINDEMKNITITDEQKAVMGTITYK